MRSYGNRIGENGGDAELNMLARIYEQIIKIFLVNTNTKIVYKNVFNQYDKTNITVYLKLEKDAIYEELNHLVPWYKISAGSGTTSLPRKIEIP